jgi:hypothetical protein
MKAFLTAHPIVIVRTVTDDLTRVQTVLLTLGWVAHLIAGFHK